MRCLAIIFSKLWKFVHWLDWEDCFRRCCCCCCSCYCCCFDGVSLKLFHFEWNWIMFNTSNSYSYHQFKVEKQIRLLTNFCPLNLKKVSIHRLGIQYNLVNIIQINLINQKWKVLLNKIWLMWSKNILSNLIKRRTCKYFATVVNSTTWQRRNLSVHIIYVIYLSLQTQRKYLDSFDRNK